MTKHQAKAMAKDMRNSKTFEQTTGFTDAQFRFYSNILVSNEMVFKFHQKPKLFMIVNIRNEAIFH